MKILVVVDMQNDFITGVLGTKEAQTIIPNVVNKIKEYIKSGNKVIFTMDTHNENSYMLSQEGKKLPVKHCIYETDGWELCKEVKNAQNSIKDEQKTIMKPTFGSLELAKELENYYPDEIE